VAQPKEPPLDWLRQSVWAGEELPEDLALLEAMELEPVKPARKRAARARTKPKRR